VQAEQLPELHTTAQDAPVFCHVPAPSHVCGCRPTHCIEPGEHTPTQLPPLHVVVHGMPDCHTPVLSQVCGVSPLQALAPGVQLPVQPLVVQTYWQAAPKSFHVSLELHNCGCKPLHRTVPGVHPASEPSPLPESIPPPASESRDPASLASLDPVSPPLPDPENVSSV